QLLPHDTAYFPAALSRRGGPGTEVEGNSLKEALLLMPLPAGTVSKLTASHPEGTRHTAKLELAMEMLGNGLTESAVEVTLLEKFPHAAPKEITEVIRWAVAHNPGPSAEKGIGNFTLRNGFFHRDAI